MILKATEEQLNSLLKFTIGITFCLILIIMAGLSMYSVVFVTQPMSGMAPADKNFFLLLSDMSKYILGALATLIAVKGKDAFVPPPGISTAADFKDAPPPKPAPVVTTTVTTVRSEGDPVAAASYAGKPAPVQPPHPERDE
jgi:hypothetical protein